MNYEWINELKVGDELFFGSWNVTPYPCKVSRITKTQIVVTYNDGRSSERYNRKTGCAVGSSGWSITRLIQNTPEVRSQVEVAQLRTKAALLVRDMKIPKDKETLVAFVAALEPFAIKEDKQ